MGLANPIHLILLLVEIGIPVLVVIALVKYLRRSTSCAPQVQRAPERESGETEASLVDVIAQLDKLREAGTLTEEEFATKKAELLARM